MMTDVIYASAQRKMLNFKSPKAKGCLSQEGHSVTECRHAVGRERRLTHHMSHGIVYYIKHLLFETFETFWKERHPNDPETPAQAEQKNHPESGRSPTPNFQTPEEKRRPPNNPQMTSLNSSRDDRYCLAFLTCKGPKSECTGASRKFSGNSNFPATSFFHDLWSCRTQNKSIWNCFPSRI